MLSAGMHDDVAHGENSCGVVHVFKSDMEINLLGLTPELTFADNPCRAILFDAVRMPKRRTACNSLGNGDRCF